MVNSINDFRTNFNAQTNNVAQADKTAKTQSTNKDFENKVMKCVSAGGKKALLCSDALMSYASPQTGESINIYKSDNYSKENPVYIIKGLDKDGEEFEQEIDASAINPKYCSYNELMVLNLETGHTSPSDYLHAVATRDKSGIGSFFDKEDYIAAAGAVMQDHKVMGNWKDYLAYDKWISDILNYYVKKHNN